MKKRLNITLAIGTSCGWEGNRRSVVALAMRHRLKWLIHIQAQGLSTPPTLLFTSLYPTLYWVDASLLIPRVDAGGYDISNNNM